MTTELTPAYIATIKPDHTITVPDDMPVGAKVMVIMVPSNVNSPEVDAERKARFESTLSAIQAAMANPVTPSLSDEDLEALVDRARKTIP